MPPSQVRSCPRNCKRRRALTYATGVIREGEQPYIRKPGDLPSLWWNQETAGRGVSAEMTDELIYGRARAMHMYVSKANTQKANVLGA